jgi:dTDP-glucose 4,6-dehydratase/dTDP-4-dehydrorhamnose 3,5-epimerase
MSSACIEHLDIDGAFLIHGEQFHDDRGYFQELYNVKKFPSPITDSWRQVSLSQSKANVLRGIHCSNYAKYVQCIQGEVYDVIVDLRPDSPTFKKWQGIWLSSTANQPVHLYVPKRCGHGFFAKTDCLFLYLQDGTYNPKEDIELNLFDKTIGIEWPDPTGPYIISKKDRENRMFDELMGSRICRPMSSVVPQVPVYLQTDILVYGASGFLGSFATDLLTKKNIAFEVGHARLENRESIVAEVERIKPTRILCFAGIAGKPNISWCEKNRIETIRANVIGQLNLADVAHEHSIHCTLLTTGVIYQYDQEHTIDNEIGFVEDDTPNFNGNFYSKMRIVEEELLQAYPNVLNLRITYPMVSGLHPKSFLTKLLRYSRIESIPISITVVDDLWPILIDMSFKRVTGTFNFNNPNTISHDEILNAYRAIVNENHTWLVVAPSKLCAASRLSSKKLLDLGYHVPDIKDSINSILMELKCQLTSDTSQEYAVKPDMAPRQIAVKDRFIPTSILVTGGAGFIGSHVAIHLANTYPHYTVIVYDVLDYCANLKNLDSIRNKPNFHFVQGDITNFAMVKFVMEHFKVDCVLHFAAQSHVDTSLKTPLRFSETNIIGTHVLLECARLAKCTRFIHVSTDEVYGTTDTVANINQVLDPTNPYACSKLAAEYVVMAYQKNYDMPILITRGNNVYGPFQFVEKVIPKFIMRLLMGQKCCIYEGSGSSERDFLYISDVVDAFDVLLHYGQAKCVYNIGATKSIVVNDLAAILVRQIKNVDNDEVCNYIEKCKGRIKDDKRYKIDSTSLKALGWTQKVDFETGIRITVDWYRTNQNYWDKFEYALEAQLINDSSSNTNYTHLDGDTAVK